MNAYVDRISQDEDGLDGIVRVEITDDDDNVIFSQEMSDIDALDLAREIIDVCGDEDEDEDYEDEEEY